jgi:hypothetical protein
MPAEAGHTHRSRAPLLLSALGVGLILMPFLFWHQTWFGRKLSDGEIDQYLRDDQHARKSQHALSQIADRLVQGDTTVRRWYPRIVVLARHRDPIVRSTAAWTMGQDAGSPLFHEALLDLLKDSDLMVRRNAALALVRFGDPTGRAELIAMLEPYDVRVPSAGILTLRTHTGQAVGAGTVLARVRTDRGGEVEIRAPYAGRLERVLEGEGARVEAGARLAALGPQSDQVWEALRGLVLVGTPEDLAQVERFERGGELVSERIREQAALTTAAIRTRSERNPSR